MKKIFSILVVSLMVFGLAACGGGNGNSSKGENGTVGISMPSKSLERWVNDGANMKQEFQAIGYGVDLQYAEDVIENQVAQIENMITKGVKAIVIAPIDGESLTDVLDKAAAEDIQVISYDRLIKKSEHVSYYATFDNFKVGVLQASYLEEKLGLKDGKGPFNIELFGGSPDDNNAYFFYDGAMSVLQPYIDNGKLVVRSGQTTMDKIAILRWDGATAQARMDNLLSANYADATVNAVLTPNDALSIGVISSLKGVGYGSGDKPMPIIPGQDAELASVKSIIAGEQTATVFKDTRALAKKVVSMVESIMKGEEAEVNDTETYDNGVKVVPSYLLEPVIVDMDNYKEVLVDSGYYTEDQLK